MRIVAIALAVAAAGCSDDTVLRIDIPDPGTSPAPASLRVTLVGTGAAPKTIAPVTFPGTLVVHHLPAALSQLCVDVEGLDAGGAVVVSGADTVAIAAHQTTRATVTLSTAMASCPAVAPPDLGSAPPDLATGGGGDLASAGDLAIALCPAGAIFCDDFESGTLAKWNSGVKFADMGTIAPSMTRAAHGVWSAETRAQSSGAANFAELEQLYPTPLPPPIAMRANFYCTQPLVNYTMILSVYDNSAKGFSYGGDSNGTWVLTEDQAVAPDHHSTVATTAGWHCLELVIDAAGMVTGYLDGAVLFGPFLRTSAVAYSGFIFGIDRTVQPDTDIFVDDVAIGPSRLYCPP